MAKDDKIRSELGTTRVRDGCVIYFGRDNSAWIFKDQDSGLLTIHFTDGTEQITAWGSGSPTGRTATYVIAASDATDKEKAQADWVCSGTADNVIIQAAIDALPTEGGKVYLTSGKFYISTAIKPRSHLTLEGTGKESTILYEADGANCNIISDTSSFATNKLSFCVRTVYFDGNRDNNVSGSAIYLAPTGAGHYWDVSVSECFIMHMSEYGIYSNDQHGYYVENTPIESNDLDGIVYTGGGYGVIFACTLKFNRYGIDSELSTHTKIIACTITDNTSTTIKAGNYAQISDNYLDIGTGTYACIYISSKDYCQVHGNFINAGSYPAVKIDTGGNYNVVTGNYVAGTISVGANTNIVRDNIGYIMPGETRTISGAITAGAAGTITSIDNPFGQTIRVLELNIKITTPDADAPNIDAGIGSSASTSYATLFNDLPGETAGYYNSKVTTPGAQTVPIEWTTGSGNRYLNIAVNNNDGTSLAATYTVTVMGN